MPLRDHFHPPLSPRKSWESIHQGWAFVMAQRLNGAILTDRFESESNVHHGTKVEIDVATFEEDRASTTFRANGNTNRNGGLATQLRTFVPSIAPLAAEVALADADTYEINIYRQDGGWKLAAVVELVSPRNKDRSSARRAFAIKVASYLQQGISVVAVDVVTDRNANLHEDISDVLHLPNELDWSSSTGLSAICYRLLRVERKELLELWPHELCVGAELPTVPLWLEPNLAVPLELELTYMNTCESLRIA